MVTNDYLDIRSVNGAKLTIVNGQSYSVDSIGRCFNLGNTESVTIKGLTISEGRIYDSNHNGAGVYCANGTAEIISCIILNNETPNYRGYYSGKGGGLFNCNAKDCLFKGNDAEEGGGMYGGSASNCVFDGNSAFWGGGMKDGLANSCKFINNRAFYPQPAAAEGGGMHGGIANNCLFTGNYAYMNGCGMYEGVANNCTFYNNDPNSYYYSTEVYSVTANNCIIWRDEFTGTTNNCWTADPLFVDADNEHFNLQVTSPCINAGDNSFVELNTDLAGQPRVINRNVDIGAYEFYASIDDLDGDGHSNEEEGITGMNPIDATSVFAVTNFEHNIFDTTNFILEWPSIVDRIYTISWTTNLACELQPITTDITYPQNSYTDTVHSVESKGFYRIDVRLF
jgi:hypothetical protein